MTVEKTRNDNGLVVTLSGKLDYAGAPVLEKEIEDLRGVTELVFDLKDLEYLSSAGLRLFLSAQKKMIKQGEMKIINANDDVLLVLEIAGFKRIMDIK